MHVSVECTHHRLRLPFRCVPIAVRIVVSWFITYLHYFNFSQLRNLHSLNVFVVDFTICGAGDLELDPEFGQSGRWPIQRNYEPAQWSALE